MLPSVSSRFAGRARATRSVLAALAWLALATQAQAQIPADLYNYSRTSSFTYQTNGLLQSETVELDNTALCVTTSYSYDALFLLPAAS